MPSPHRIARARWPLTIGAAFLLLITIASGWVSVGYSWTGGNVQLGGGGISGFYTDGTTVPLFPGRGWLVHAGWSDPFFSQAVDATFFKGTYRAFVSLLPIALVLVLMSAWAWYRYRRPFERTGRPDRRGQFRRLRWTFTAISAISLGAAASSYWVMFEFRNTTTQVLVVNGAAKAAHKANPKPPTPQPGSPPGTVILPQPSVAPTVSFIGARRMPRWGTSVYQFYWDEWPDWSHFLNLWFLSALALAPTSLFWLLHLRRYPSATHCSACRYDRAGLGASGPCPECGHVPQTPSAAAR